MALNGVSRPCPLWKRAATVTATPGSSRPGFRRQPEHQDLAKQFIAYLYSDEAAAIFATGGRHPAHHRPGGTLSGDNKVFYSIYDNGAKAALGSFAATEAMEGLDTRSVWFDPMDSVVTGDKTEQDWIAGVKNQLRAALKCVKQNDL